MTSMWGRCNKLLKQSLTSKKVKSALKIFRCVETKENGDLEMCGKRNPSVMFPCTWQRHSFRKHANFTAITKQSISLIRIKKFPFSWLREGKGRLTLLQPATENPKEGKKKQRTKDQETKNKIRHESSMSNSTSPTPVQGPSTVACMIVTSLSQLSQASSAAYSR